MCVLFLTVCNGLKDLIQIQRLTSDTNPLKNISVPFSIIFPSTPFSTYRTNVKPKHNTGRQKKKKSVFMKGYPLCFSCSSICFHTFCEPRSIETDIFHQSLLFFFPARPSDNEQRVSRSFSQPPSTHSQSKVRFNCAGR